MNSAIEKVVADAAKAPGEIVESASELSKQTELRIMQPITRGEIKACDFLAEVKLPKILANLVLIFSDVKMVKPEHFEMLRREMMDAIKRTADEVSECGAAIGVHPGVIMDRAERLVAQMEANANRQRGVLVLN